VKKVVVVLVAGGVQTPDCHRVLVEDVRNGVGMSLKYSLMGFVGVVFCIVSMAGGCKKEKPVVFDPGANCYLATGKDVAMIGRVTLVELENLSTHPMISADVSSSLYEELQKKNLFGLARVSIDDPIAQGLFLNSSRTLSYEELDLLRKSLKTDAIIIGAVTQYYPYPRLTLGLRLKMIDLRDGSLIWAIEQLWDTTDKSTEKRIECYFKSQVRSGYEPLNYRVALVSPRMFLKFVAHETASTLKARK